MTGPVPPGTPPARLLVLGAGGRGAHAYAQWCLEHPQEGRVVAVAEPDAERRDRLGDAHGVPAAHRFPDWRQALAAPGPWDAVVVATPDRDHVDPTLRALDLGLHVLLEKPIAPTEEELHRLTSAARHSAGTVTVAHVLRYTPFFRTLRRLLDEGRIGQLQGISHIENVAYWHFAHSYVRGNWHRADRSSPMLLAKACHDLDILRWLVGAPCTEVVSFGERRHFRAEHAPAGSTERCVDGCAVADTCPYNAERLYVDQLAAVDGPPVTVVTNDTSVAGRQRALRLTDYGRCVYRMDNDVVDHQTAALRFGNGVTASLVVSAFTAQNTRTITLMGSHGEISADMRSGRISLTPFAETPPSVDTGRPDQTFQVGAGSHGVVDEVIEAFTGHGGGDAGLMLDFTGRVRRWLAGEDVEAAPSSLEESVESHLVAFAAERSRLHHTVEEL
ncbi:Gfo/Idh/MocA family protein [Micromonospora echinospora]|uniref:Gfo/Idh/MocA family protein n=1 Tax=Micromonospora echinospora TaxID=1877 RepID=UPI00366BC2B8